MYTFILVVHVIVVVTLIGLILVQRGRSSGLIEALGGVESIFGTKTSSFFVKATVVLAILFFTTSITLAYLSRQRSKSLLERFPLEESISGEGKTQDKIDTSENKSSVSKEKKDSSSEK